MKPMNEEHLAILRRHMVEVIAIQFDLMSEEIGKGKLNERVAAAMLRVRGTSSFRLRLPPSPTMTHRSRSASIRRSRSPSSLRS